MGLRLAYSFIRHVPPSTNSPYVSIRNPIIPSLKPTWTPFCGITNWDPFATTLYHIIAGNASTVFLPSHFHFPLSQLPLYQIWPCATSPPNTPLFHSVFKYIDFDWILKIQPHVYHE